MATTVEMMLNTLLSVAMVSLDLPWLLPSACISLLRLPAWESRAGFSLAIAGAEREPAEIATAVVAATIALRDKSFMKLLLSVKVGQQCQSS